MQGIYRCLRAAPSPPPRPPDPHLQVNVPHPLEYPLVGPDHGVYVLCLAAGAALLEGLVGVGRQWVSWGWGSTQGVPKSKHPWCWGALACWYKEEFWPASTGFSGPVNLGLDLSFWEMGRSLLLGGKGWVRPSCCLVCTTQTPHFPDME